ncbi:MAG TPA: YggT family protein [Gemmatimonadaceae bacterium]|jgi:YggT family protein|nr:YggT family protein [Gemmatimonadaceae bacterium]
MNTTVVVFDQVLGAVRFALAIIAGIFAIFCVIDWLVRTRRVNLFGPLARFSRSRIDPVLEPIERRVLRAGGNPASAPLWALAAVVIGGILLISVLDFLRDEILGLAFALQGGAGGLFKLLVAWTFDFIRIAILVRVVSSWLPISPYSGWIRWSYVVSEPILKPLRQVIPAMGPIDITPIIAYFLIGFLQVQVLRLM